MHEKALISVALFHKKPVACFVCARKTRPLELDHIRYALDSVRRGHGAERSEEAMLHPERFRILCRGCHVGIDLKSTPEKPDPSIGSEVRAHQAAKNRIGRRDALAEVVRKEEVIQRQSEEKRILYERTQTLEAELDRALSLLNAEGQEKGALAGELPKVTSELSRVSGLLNLSKKETERRDETIAWLCDYLETLTKLGHARHIETKMSETENLVHDWSLETALLFAPHKETEKIAG
jgi:hypothetical protein